MTLDAILGRTLELDLISRFFDRERTGAGGLLIEGEAGIGKTTLWREAVRMAGEDGMVLTSRASEAEARLSFTVLGDLLVPVLTDDVLGQLPGGQRRGLEVALLLAEPTRTRPDARAVSLAVLAVLRVLAKSGSVTIGVDDVQWVDAPSARTLAFALRRLEVEPIAVVAARRLGPGSGEPLDLDHTLSSGLERIRLSSLDETSLGRLLRTRLDREFPLPLVSRIREQSAGNPFFAIEIGRALGESFEPPVPGAPLPVPRDLEEILQRRLSALSDDARRAGLLVAAATAPLRDVVESAGGSAAGIKEAVVGGIIAPRGASLGFTHPLLASTVYGSATDRERRRAHARLAEVSTDPEERARHLALSTEEPSEEIAKALDDAAQRAGDRGAPLAAAQMLELAATLTPPSVDVAPARRLSAAAHLFDAGDAEAARAMVEGLIEGLEPGSRRAAALRVLAFMSWNDVDRVRRIARRALEEVGDDAFQRAKILVEMAWAELQACRPATASILAEEARALAEPFDDPVPERLALSVLSTAEVVLGRPARAHIERAIALQDSTAPGETTWSGITQGRMLLWAGDIRTARDVLEAALVDVLDQGRAAATWEILVHLAEVELRAGRWDRAARHADDAHEVALDAGRSNVSGQILSVTSAIAAARGQHERARRDGLEALSLCQRNGDRWYELVARSSLGFLELAQGDPAAAHAWLASATATCGEMDLRDPGVFPFIPDEVEALIGLGEVDDAERLTVRLEAQGRELDRPLALATAGRCRGLIAGARGELESAAEHLDRSLDEHARADHPLESGRTLLVAGEVQRRMRRKRSAREYLDRARSAFDELGATAWSARARQELARIGGRAPAPTELSATELQVARLVGEGGTNREVANALFMSSRTVEAHLRRIYQKLGVRSRTEMTHRLNRRHTPSDEPGQRSEALKHGVPTDSEGTPHA